MSSSARELPSSGGALSARFSYSQAGVARKHWQDYQIQQNRHRHVFEQPRAETDLRRPARRQSFPVSYSQISTDNSGIRRRQPRSTLLPTPRVPLPVRPQPIGNYWQSSNKKRAKGATSSKADNVHRRTLMSGSGFHHGKAVKRAQPQEGPDGKWMDKNGRLRNQDSDSSSDPDSMDLDQPSSPFDDLDVEVVQPKLSARKTRRRPSDVLSVVNISSNSDEEDIEDVVNDQEEAIADSESEKDNSESEEDNGDSDVIVIGDNIGTESLPVPSDALIQAIKPFLPQLAPRNLPFLRRNFRVGFKKLFTNHVRTGEVLLRVLFRATSEERRWSFTLNSWSCPLCNLLGDLDTRQMLHSHLEWHHSGVKVSWLKETDLEWRLILSFPVPSTSRTGHSIAPYFRYATVKEVVARADHDAPGNYTINSLTMEDELDSDVYTNIRLTPATPLPDNPFPARSPPVSDIPSSPLASFALPSQARSVTIAEAVQSTPLTSRYPPPPPADDPLGPAAQYPYLPATSDDGKIEIQYSCRVGGPYLFDLLGLLPLDEFGVLSWIVLDQENEIFEDQELSEEGKVMYALWGRWITLNRKQFIQDYLVGTIDFVDKYWLMIHRAAGWSALRYWLLMLMAHRYLQASGVAHVLKHYEEKTGMKYWYNN